MGVASLPPESWSSISRAAWRPICSRGWLTMVSEGRNTRDKSMMLSKPTTDISPGICTPRSFKAMRAPSVKS